MKKSTISKIIAIISYHVTKKGSQKFKKKRQNYTEIQKAYGALNEGNTINSPHEKSPSPLLSSILERTIDHRWYATIPVLTYSRFFFIEIY